MVERNQSKSNSLNPTNSPRMGAMRKNSRHRDPRPSRKLRRKRTVRTRILRMRNPLTKKKESGHPKTVGACCYSLKVNSLNLVG